MNDFFAKGRAWGLVFAATAAAACGGDAEKPDMHSGATDMSVSVDSGTVMPAPTTFAGKWSMSYPFTPDMNTKETQYFDFVIKEDNTVNYRRVIDYTHDTSPMYQCHYVEEMKGTYTTTSVSSMGTTSHRVVFALASGSWSQKGCAKGADTSGVADAMYLRDWSSIFSRDYTLMPGKLILYSPPGSTLPNFVFAPTR